MKPYDRLPHDRLPFEGFDEPGPVPDQVEAQGEPDVWERIADLLERIERNTRAWAAPSREALPARAAGRLAEEARFRSRPPLAVSRARPARLDRAPAGSGGVPKEATKTARAISAVLQPAPAFKTRNRPAGSTPETARPERAARRREARPEQGPTISQQAHERGREEAVARTQAEGVLGVLKRNLASWDGTVAAPDASDMQNAAGLAAGGPMWAAVKEVKDAIESQTEDENSLAAILKKTVADKTGLTGVRERLDQTKETARAKVLAWAGVPAEDAPERASASRRDEKGRFLKSGNAPDMVQAKLAKESLALAKGEAAADKKRHDELIDAVHAGSGKESGGGVFGEGGLLDRVRGRRERPGRTAAARRGRTGRLAGGRSARRGGLFRGRGRGLAGMLAGGVSALAGGAALLDSSPTELAMDLGGSLLTTPAAGKAVTATVGKAGGVLGKAAGLGRAGGALGKAAGLGARGALGAAKAIPVAGQLLAAGMAVYDGVQGWNDTAMHQEAFGLTDGQEASTGQKASSAAANVLDMGGLLTGAAGLLGLDVSTADLARGIYGIGDGISSSLSDAWGGITGLFSGDAEAMTKGAGGAAKLAAMMNPLTAGFSLLGFGKGEEKDSAVPAEQPAAPAPPAGEKRNPYYPSWLELMDNPRAQMEIRRLADEMLREDEKKQAQAAAGTTIVAPDAATGHAGRAAQSGSPTATVAAAEPESETKGLFERLTDALSALTGKIEEQLKDEDTAPAIAGSLGFFSGSWGGMGGQRKRGAGKAPPLNAQALDQAQAIQSGELGALSARYESGARGSAAVGWDRTGGTSYGKYQIATRTGTMNSFLEYAKEHNPEVYARLSAAGPADAGKDGAFAQEWKALAAEGKMGDLEHDFIKSTHFDPAFARIEDEGLRKRIEGSKALQDVLWSTSVQHGGSGAARLVNRNYKEGMSDEEFIEALYADRSTQFGSSSAAVQNSVRNRFAQEKEIALAMRRKEQESGETALAQAGLETAAPEPAAVARQERAEEVVAVQAASVRNAPEPAPAAVAQALPPPPAARYPEPAPIRSEPQQHVPTPGADMMGKMVALLSQLVDVTRQQAQKQDKDTEAANTPNIPMDYSDPYCAALAHDRA